MTPADTLDSQDELLKTVAESIGSTLGNLAARANAVKDAVTPSPETQAKVVREAKAARGKARTFGKRVARKISAATKTAKASSKKTAKKAHAAKGKAKKVARKAKKAVKKAKKTVRKAVKKARR